MAARHPSPRREAGSRPLRTCIGCGGKDQRSELTRLVVGKDGLARIDEGKAAHGRGAWVHPRETCLQQAESQRALGRAFRGKARGLVPLPATRPPEDGSTKMEVAPSSG